MQIESYTMHSFGLTAFCFHSAWRLYYVSILLHKVVAYSFSSCSKLQILFSMYLFIRPSRGVWVVSSEGSYEYCSCEYYCAFWLTCTCNYLGWNVGVDLPSHRTHICPASSRCFQRVFQHSVESPESLPCQSLVLPFFFIDSF